MKIGVVGSEGVVGGACKFGFELLGVIQEMVG